MERKTHECHGTTVRIGYVGCGARGQGVLKECLAQMKDVEIAVCAIYPRTILLRQKRFWQRTTVLRRKQPETGAK